MSSAKPINGHDALAAGTDAPVPPATQGILKRTQVGFGEGRPPKLVYVLDGTYVGEIEFVCTNAVALPEMAKDFVNWVADAQKAPAPDPRRVALLPPGSDISKLR